MKNASMALLTLIVSFRVLPTTASGALRFDANQGDWRRHEIVRTFRDEAGCRLSVVSYHRPDGDVDTRLSRDCGRE
ncbi:hypothetical protein M2322_004570 [Rhodoblastus acidophilus]|uniref:hypothetical protein n=1 Tax=Rhodoblastus acidophilus TaxID=1074 RepID=UPI002223FA3B|nr:hypothetical protein [Rhodoblastus acidophilus]MCW2319001.1 hypothetical protein [Rhodoblastus acidophilus]